MSAFKRANRPGYAFKFQHAGKLIYRSGFATKAQAQTAERAARKLCQDGLLAQLEGCRRRREAPPCCTVGEYLAAYAATRCSEASATTRRSNANALRHLLRTTRPGAEVDALPLSVCDRALMQAWFDLARAGLEAVATDPAAARRLKVTANSTANQAKSCLIPAVIARLRRGANGDGLAIPDLAGLHDAFKEERFGKVGSGTYDPPADDLVHRTLADWEQLGDRDLFLAIGHELAFGLRAGELLQAEWSWHAVREGYPVLDATAAIVKNGSGRIQVRALDPWFSTLWIKARVRGWWGTEGRIISGQGTILAVSDWLRAHGWETQKTNHELRKYAGSQIIMRYGAYEAQTWLRHSSVAVTETFYASYVRTFRPADVTTLPARWATVTAASPVLAVVTATA